MNFLKTLNKKGDKYFFYYDYGRLPGQRPSTGIFVYAKPKNQIEKNHNKEAMLLLDVKKSQRIIEQQAVGSAFIPTHKFKANFLEYYEEYVKDHRSDDNRHLPCSFTKFKLFIKKDFISPIDITEDFCKRFRKYLMEHLTGETPQNYFARFKWVVKAATKAGYFQQNPTEEVSALANASVALKENLEIDEYEKLLRTPCSNEDIKSAFLFCLYTGLRWVDVKKLEWKDIKENILTTRIIQKKTGLPVILTLHPIARSILETQMTKAKARSTMPKRVFELPSANGANGILEEWVHSAGIDKYVTWSCARLSFSILLQDKNVDDATVAYLMGHTTTKQVRTTYKRHRPKNQMEAISKLPMPEHLFKRSDTTE